MLIVIPQATSGKITKIYNKRKKGIKMVQERMLLKAKGGCNEGKRNTKEIRHIRQIEKWNM